MIYIKNSGLFPEAETLTLEWVGNIPGKRESRRFEGDYMLVQQDIVEQRIHEDAVAYGGWSLDLHPADGIYSEEPGCNQWHSKGIYQIPYRCLYSKNISNLFLAGRIISASHVAFASSRVMGTCANVGQAVGMAAALCTQLNLLPAALGQNGHIGTLQQELLAFGHYIPRLTRREEKDLVQVANIVASSSFTLEHITANGKLLPLVFSSAQMLPVEDKVPQIMVPVIASVDTILEVQLRVSSNPFNHTPDTVLGTKSFALKKGTHELEIDFEESINTPQYVFICFMKNDKVILRAGKERVTGLLSVFNSYNKAVSNFGQQEPIGDIGVDAFEFWCPQRRPQGHNIAMQIKNGSGCFAPENIANGWGRPVNKPNAWVASLEDEKPQLTISWQRKQILKKVVITFDTDFDHPMESSLMGHPDSRMPFCVRNYQLMDDTGKVIYEADGNYQTKNEITFDKALATSQLILVVEHPAANIPAAIMELKCYTEA